MKKQKGITMTDNLPQTTSSVPSEHEMMVYQTMSKQAVDSKMYKGIGEQAGVMMIMLAARELGIPPMTALNGGLNIIQGKVEISARMMNALIRKAGHKIFIIESTDEKCTLLGQRRDNNDKAEVSFSIEDAKKAGLIKPNGGWVKCPKDMCFARALSRLARQLFSDVIGIGYIEGEIQAKETPAEPILAEIQPSFVAIEDVSQMYERILNIIGQDQAESFGTYTREVMTHFNWSDVQTYREFLKDENKLKEKFEKWKSLKKKD